MLKLIDKSLEAEVRNWSVDSNLLRLVDIAIFVFWHNYHFQAFTYVYVVYIIIVDCYIEFTSSKQIIVMIEPKNRREFYWWNLVSQLLMLENHHANHFRYSFIEYEQRTALSVTRSSNNNWFTIVENSKVY